MYEGGLHIVYVPLRHVPLMMPSQRRSRTQRIPVEDYARTTPDVRRRLTAQQKDEDNGDKKRLVCLAISLGARLLTPSLSSFPGLPVFYSLGVGKNEEGRAGRLYHIP